jgi:hypothetical protein
MTERLDMIPMALGVIQFPLYGWAMLEARKWRFIVPIIHSLAALACVMMRSDSFTP